MHAVLGRLVLKAHVKRTQACAQFGITCQVPEYVKALQAKEELRQYRRLQRLAMDKQKGLEVQPGNDLARILHIPQIPLEELLPSDTLGIDSWDDIDWDDWIKMVNEW